jgi:hypothetical protein
MPYEGVAAGVEEGVGVGLGLASGLGVEEASGLDEPDGLGDGLGEGVAPLTGGVAPGAVVGWWPMAPTWYRTPMVPPIAVIMAAMPVMT